jgi:hypothetical protein
MVERYRQGQDDERDEREDRNRQGGQRSGGEQSYGSWSDGGYGDQQSQGSAQHRYVPQRDYGGRQGQREHDLPVYGSGRGPYAHLAGYGADSGVGPDNYVIGSRTQEGQWQGHDQHGPQANSQQRPSYGPYGGQQQSQRDYGAWGAQGYGGEGGSGAQGYGGQGAYARYGSQSDYGAPGGYGGDRIYRQSGPQFPPTGGSARYGNQVSYGQGVYGGYGQGDMGTGTGQGGQSWGNWGQSGVMGRSQHRGPKGYQRSDERLKEEICERLIARWDIDSSEVSVDVQNGKVMLEGTVPDRRMRHEIENLVDDCYGVLDIENQVRVQRSYGSTTSGSASESRGQQQSSPPITQPGQNTAAGSTLGATTRPAEPKGSSSSEKKDT